MSINSEDEVKPVHKSKNFVEPAVNRSAVENPKLRGSGRTHRQLDKVPPGSVFLVHNAAMKATAANILSKMDKVQSVKVLIMHDVHSLQMLRGSSMPVYVDHWLWDHCTLDFRDRLESLRNLVRSS